MSHMHIAVINKNGVKCDLAFQPGDTLLHVLEKNNIRISSFCEGSGICGGCHVIIENQVGNIPFPTELEESGLDKVRGTTINSRLACQLVLNGDMDGLVVRIP